MSDELREALAEYAHIAWSGWMKYLFGKGEYRIFQTDDGLTETRFIMPAWAVRRWGRQMQTPYAELPQEEKESDRKEADAMLAIMREHLSSGESALVAALTQEVAQARAWEAWQKDSRLILEKIAKQQAERIEKLNADARNWEKAVQDLVKVSLQLVDENLELKHKLDGMQVRRDDAEDRGYPIG